MARVASQIRLEEELYAKLKAIADRELRSVNAQMEYFLIRSVEQYERDNPVTARKLERE